jgi:hypothetical protein
MMISPHRGRAHDRAPRSMLVRLLALGAIAVLPVLLGVTSANASIPPRTAFVFVSPHIAGAPIGSVAMTGIGTYDTSTGALRSSGLFRCTDSVGQGPLMGCLKGQGVHWSSTTLNGTQRFVCGTDAPKTVTTDNRTVAFNADFFRAGDGGTPSFSANVIVSAHDIAPDVQGIQNTWIQGVGCGSALQFFAG